MKKVLLVAVSVLLVCTSCVTKKKYLLAENGRLEAIARGDDLQNQLVNCRDNNDGLTSRLASLERDTTRMGKNIRNYDSMVVLTHFKGHAMGGFGGSMKNIAIGCADGKIGKQQVHAIDDVSKPWDQWPGKELLMETMSESAKATCDHFGKRICFINVMRRMSVDCDCAGLAAAEPTIPDIGIAASTDILAVDQASVDLVYSQTHNHDLVERMESRHGLHQLTYMRELGMGAANYELIEID